MVTMKPKIVLQYNTNSKKLMGNVAVSKKHRREVIIHMKAKKRSISHNSEPFHNPLVFNKTDKTQTCP
jgi:hypothetical protein